MSSLLRGGSVGRPVSDPSWPGHLYQPECECVCVRFASCTIAATCCGEHSACIVLLPAFYSLHLPVFEHLQYAKYCK